MIQRLADSGAARRLAWFLAGVVVLLAALELFERRHSALFAAATHRGLTKAAMFDGHDRVNVLFLGSSRTQDGVSPDLVTRVLQRVAPDLGDLPGFNAAFTGSSLGALIALAPRFDQRRDVRIAVIELSEPQIFNEAAPWEPAQSADASLEGRLAVGLQHVAIVRYRKALIGANLGRLPSLLAPSSLGGWETKGGEQLASWMGKREAFATDFDSSRWRPEVITASTAPVTLDESSGAAADQLAQLSARYRDRGIVPIFAVPPLSTSEREAPERHGLRALFAEVARRGQCEVWNFAPVELPEAFFRDASHLNREGRAQFSEALAQEIARILKAGGKPAGQR